MRAETPFIGEFSYSALKWILKLTWEANRTEVMANRIWNLKKRRYLNTVKKKLSLCIIIPFNWFPHLVHIFITLITLIKAKLLSPQKAFHFLKQHWLPPSPLWPSFRAAHASPSLSWPWALPSWWGEVCTLVSSNTPPERNLEVSSLEFRGARCPASGSWLPVSCPWKCCPTNPWPCWLDGAEAKK